MVSYKLISLCRKYQQESGTSSKSLTILIDISVCWVKHVTSSSLINISVCESDVVTFCFISSRLVIRHACFLPGVETFSAFI